MRQLSQMSKEERAGLLFALFPHETKKFAQYMIEKAKRKLDVDAGKSTVPDSLAYNILMSDLRLGERLRKCKHHFSHELFNNWSADLSIPYLHDYANQQECPVEYAQAVSFIFPASKFIH